MNQDEINQKFQRARDSITLMAKQQEEEITSQVKAIREDAMKKLGSLFESD